MSDNMININVLNQKPSAHNVYAESPLHHIEKPTNSHGTVKLSEQALFGHLILRGHVHELVPAVQTVVGAELPVMPMTSVEHADITMRWVSPNEWLLTAPSDSVFDLERQLRATMTGHFAIVNNSGGQTILLLSGPDAENVLKKSTAYDVHISHFPTGKVVTSTFVKSQVLIRRTGVDSFELIIRRSFADYIWRWIVDASLEYGLLIDH